MDYKLRELLEEITFTFSVLEEQTVRNSWLDEQILVVQNLVTEVNELDNESSSIDKNKKLSKETLDEINKTAKKLFKEIDFRVKTDNETLYKSYFPKNLSQVSRVKGGFLRAFENIKQKLNDESIESILVFKDRVSEIITKLKEMDKNMINLSSNKEFSRVDKSIIYKKLNLEYSRLKYIIQALYMGTKIKYSMFILRKK